MPPAEPLPEYLRHYLRLVFPWPLSPTSSLAERLTADKKPERIWADMSPGTREVMKGNALFYHRPCDPTLCAVYPLFKWLSEELKKRYDVVNAAEVLRQKRWKATRLDALVRLNEVPIFVVNLDCDDIIPVQSIPLTPWGTLDLAHCLLIRADLKKLTTRKVPDDKTKGHGPRTAIKEWLKYQPAEFDKRSRPEQVGTVKSDKLLADIFKDGKGPKYLTILEYIKQVRGTRK